jgi:hypothetical protein
LKIGPVCQFAGELKLGGKLNRPINGNLLEYMSLPVRREALA